MSSFFFDRRRSEHLAELLEDPNRLRRHRRLSRSEMELDWGVRMFQRIESLPHGPQPHEEFRDGLRAMLMDAARRKGDSLTTATNLATNGAVNRAKDKENTVALGALAAATQQIRQVPQSRQSPSVPRSSGQRSSEQRSSVPRSSGPGSSGPGSSGPGSSVPGSSVPGSSVPGSSVPGSSVPRAQTPGTGRTRAAMLVGVTAGALALSGVSAASTDSLPGDPLYQVKRSSERAQLALAASDQTRGQLYLEFARSRGLEARKIGNSPLADVLADMNGETVSGVYLLTAAAVQRDDASILAAISSFVAQQRELLGELHKTLSAADVEPMRSAARMLDSIERRVHELTYALLQGCQIPTVDTLGPQPSSC